MTKKAKFNIDVFDCTVHVIITDKPKEVINAHFRANDCATIDYAPAGFCANFRANAGRIGNYYLIFDVNFIEVNTVNHEKSHLVEFILTDRSIRASGEIRSYLDGFLSKKITQCINRKGFHIES